MIKRNKLNKFWGSEESLTVFLCVLLVRVFLLPLLPADYLFTDIVVDVLTVFILISGITACPSNQSLRSISIILVVVSVVFNAAGYWYEQNSQQQAIDIALSTLCILLFIQVILYQVFKDGDVTTQRLLGAISVYIMLGLVCANLYELIYLLNPESFNFATETLKQPFNPKQQFIYFSFVNLTTTGFGDIVPVSDVARSCSMLESLIGQLFPTVLIGRLVSLFVGVKKK
jgi:hypothetical protein